MDSVQFQFKTKLGSIHFSHLVEFYFFFGEILEKNWFNKIKLKNNEHFFVWYSYCEWINLNRMKTIQNFPNYYLRWTREMKIIFWCSKNGKIQIFFRNFSVNTKFSSFYTEIFDEPTIARPKYGIQRSEENFIVRHAHTIESRTLFTLIEASKCIGGIVSFLFCSHNSQLQSQLFPYHSLERRIRIRWLGGAYTHCHTWWVFTKNCDVTRHTIAWT